MIVCRHFVLLHVPKTGGTWAARSVLLPHAPEAWELREVPPKHGGVADIPIEHRGKPMFAFVRNPWDWYVSWWAFHRRIWHDRTFADGLGEGWATGDADPARLPRWRALFDRGLDPMSEFREALPFMCEHESASLYFNRVVGPGPEVTVLRYEHIREGMEHMLAPFNAPPAMFEALGSARIWDSVHEHRSVYYTDEMAALVARADAGLIERFGYSL